MESQKERVVMCDMHEQTKQLAHNLAAQKEKLIKDAITHLIGDDWSIADVTGRGKFYLLPDKTEIFNFDGVDLIHFLHNRTEVDDSKTGMFMRAVTDYRLFYT